MHGILRSVIPQPPPFGLRHGVLAQRTLCCEPRSFEEAFLFAQFVDSSRVLPFGQLPCQAYDIPEPVLSIVNFCSLEQPIPVQIRICERNPGECLRQPRL